MPGFGKMLAGWWDTLRHPSLRYSLLALLTVGFGAGIVFWGGFNTVMEATNTMPFCVSCHEMRDNVYKEYSTTIHYQNRTGVQATCSDCHVPKEWIHKVVRKIQATNELFHWALGSVNTPEKFDAKRLTLASHVWTSMKGTDSRECRNCHTIESMNPEFQRPRARKSHLAAMEAGNTCIDCHKGIAHKNVRDKVPDRELEELEKPLAAYIRQIPETYRVGLRRAEEREAAADARRKAEIEAEAKKLAAAMQAKSATAPAPAAEPVTPPQPAPSAAAPSAAAPSPAAAAVAGPGAIDWNGIEAKTVTLFYPGQASYEWVQGREHGGARAFTRGGDRCSECHAKELKDMGGKIVSGQKLEPTPIKGKRPFVDVAVQAAVDSEKLYLRFQWQNAAHAPVPFVEGGKMDPDNQIKLAVMIAGKDIERADQAGCWVTCHHDSRYMPDASKPEALKASPFAETLDLKDGLTKYLAETRTAIELRGEDGKPRGGGLNLKLKEALAELAKNGTVMDLLRFRSKAGAENGHVLEQRVNSGGAATEMSGRLDGDTWTVVMSRPLKSDRPGDVNLELGKTYIVNFALHDDHSNARFHHVSLEWRLGLGTSDAEINAVKR
jgi:cytochrome c-type protein NapC